MPAAQTPTRRRQSRASRASDPAQLQVVPNPSETPKPQPKPEPKPTAKVQLGGRQVTYWFPAATLADGTKVSCPHAKYGHESEASARRCIAALVAQRGHRVS